LIFPRSARPPTPVLEAVRAVLMPYTLMIFFTVLGPVLSRYYWWPCTAVLFASHIHNSALRIPNSALRGGSTRLQKNRLQTPLSNPYNTGMDCFSGFANLCSKRIQVLKCSLEFYESALCLLWWVASAVPPPPWILRLDVPATGAPAQVSKVVWQYSLFRHISFPPPPPTPNPRRRTGSCWARPRRRTGTRSSSQGELFFGSQPSPCLLWPNHAAGQLSRLQIDRVRDPSGADVCAPGRD